MWVAFQYTCITGWPPVSGETETLVSKNGIGFFLRSVRFVPLYVIVDGIQVVAQGPQVSRSYTCARIINIPASPARLHRRSCERDWFNMFHTELARSSQR